MEFRPELVDMEKSTRPTWNKIRIQIPKTHYCPVCNHIFEIGDLRIDYNPHDLNLLYNGLWMSIEVEAICPNCSHTVNDLRYGHSTAPIDELIANDILNLNKKGYRTMACCEGHVLRGINPEVRESSVSQPYVAFVRQKGIEWNKTVIENCLQIIGKFDLQLSVDREDPDQTSIRYLTDIDLDTYPDLETCLEKVKEFRKDISILAQNLPVIDGGFCYKGFYHPSNFKMGYNVDIDLSKYLNYFCQNNDCNAYNDSDYSDTYIKLTGRLNAVTSVISLRSLRECESCGNYETITGNPDTVTFLNRITKEFKVQIFSANINTCKIGDKYAFKDVRIFFTLEEVKNNISEKIGAFWVSTDEINGLALASLVLDTAGYDVEAVCSYKESDLYVMLYHIFKQAYEYCLNDSNGKEE